MNEDQNPFRKVRKAEAMSGGPGDEMTLETAQTVIEKAEQSQDPETVMEAASQHEHPGPAGPAVQPRPPAKKARAKRAPRKPPIGHKEPPKKVGETQKQGRIPVGLREFSQTPTRTGYRRRWVTDKEDRINMFREGGYTEVLGPDNQPRKRRGGAGTMQYLMEIDQGLYDSDQQEKYKKWNETNQERLKPREGMKGFYTPRTKIN